MVSEPPLNGTGVPFIYISSISTLSGFPRRLGYRLVPFFAEYFLIPYYIRMYANTIQKKGSKRYLKFQEFYTEFVVVLNF